MLRLLSSVSLALLTGSAAYSYYDDDYYEEYENVVIKNAPDAYKYVYERKLAYNYGTTDEGFGKSISMLGDRLLVGAYEDPTKGDKAGAAHVFMMDSSQMGWRRVCTIVNNDTAAYDYFGWSVSLSNKFALIGAWQNDDAGTNAGAAYFFQKTSDYVTDGEEEWTLHSKVFGWEHDDSFGIDVALANDNLAVIGAPGGTNAAGDYGSGYVSVFRYINNVWSETDVIEASDPSAGDFFGMSLSLDASIGRIVVGAYGYGLYDNAKVGIAYVVDISTSGAYKQIQQLKALDSVSGDEFGRSVSISGNTVAVGATGDDDSGDASGSVYIFELGYSGNQQTYTQKVKLVPGAECSYCYFGTTLDMMNDTLVVGLHGGSQVAGSVWMYQRDLSTKDSNFEFVYVLNATDSIGGDQFGSSVSIDSKYLVVGAVTSNGFDYETGAVYVYGKTPHYVAEEDGLSGMLIGSSVVAILASFGAIGVYFFYFGSKHASSGDHIALMDSSTTSSRGLTEDSSRRGLTDDSSTGLNR